MNHHTPKTKDPRDVKLHRGLPVLGRHKRHLGDGGLSLLASYDNVHLGARLVLPILDVSHRDVLAQRGAGHAAGDGANLLAILLNLGTLARGRTRDDEADTAALDARATLALGGEL